ncbi:MAG: transporter substrate-binding domain-containing protein, partial [Prochloraceae cyanobacterium]
LNNKSISVICLTLKHHLSISLETFTSIFRVEAGKVDAAISGITITAKCLQTIDFSQAYFKSGLAHSPSARSLRDRYQERQYSDN